MGVSPRISAPRLGRALGPGDVRIHYRAVDASDAAAEASARRVLSSDEQERAARFVFARDRAAYVAAHALLRNALSAYEDVSPDAWTFAQNGRDKPALAARHAGAGLTFNLAHTEGLVACAIGRGLDVGIDVERLREDVPALELASRFFSPAEVAGLAAGAGSARARRFIELWTLKESYVKAIGQGLSHPLDGFGFALSGSSGLRFEAPAGVDAGHWQFVLYAPSARHRLALAVRSGESEGVRITLVGGDTVAARLLRASS